MKVTKIMALVSVLYLAGAGISCSTVNVIERGFVTGKVISTSGKAVPGYKVDLGLGRSAVSSETGMFVIQGIKPGNYRLSGSGKGYCPVEIEFNYADKTSVLYVQVEELLPVLKKTEILLNDGKGKEAVKKLEEFLPGNEDNELLRFYLKLALYKASPSEKLKKEIKKMAGEI